MAQRTRSHCTWPWGYLLGLAACNPVEKFLDALLAQEGKHSVYYSDPEAVACAGNAAHVDGFAPFIAGELGLDLRGRVHSVWLSRAQIEEVGCAQGCRIEEYAVSYLPVHLHENVHVVTGQHDLNRWPFLAEGVATMYDWWDLAMYGPRYVLLADPDDLFPDPREMMTIADLESEFLHYGVAASFVTLLMARHGPEKLVELMRTPVPDTVDGVEAAFRRVYGSELADEVELFVNGPPPCEADMFPVVPYDCAAPGVAWLDERYWFYVASMDCRESDVVGGVRGDDIWGSHHSVTMDVERAGTYQFQVESDGDVKVQVGECFGCPWEHRYHIVTPGSFADIELVPGRHYVRMVATSDQAPTVQVSIQPNPLADL